MADTKPADRTDRNKPPQGRRFQRGVSGNPGGRPIGARGALKAALGEVPADRLGRIVERILALAEQGDLRAAEIVLARLWPVRRGCPVPIALPRIAGAADLVAAHAVVVAAMGDGAISPEEGAAVQAVLEGARRSMETADLLARLDALEKRA